MWYTKYNLKIPKSLPSRQPFEQRLSHLPNGANAPIRSKQFPISVTNTMSAFISPESNGDSPWPNDSGLPRLGFCIQGSRLALACQRRFKDLLVHKSVK